MPVKATLDTRARQTRTIPGDNDGLEFKYIDKNKSAYPAHLKNDPRHAEEMEVLVMHTNYGVWVLTVSISMISGHLLHTISLRYMMHYEVLYTAKSGRSRTRFRCMIPLPPLLSPDRCRKDSYNGGIPRSAGAQRNYSQVFRGSCCCRAESCRRSAFFVFVTVQLHESTLS